MNIFLYLHVERAATKDIIIPEGKAAPVSGFKSAS